MDTRFTKRSVLCLSERQGIYVVERDTHIRTRGLFQFVWGRVLRNQTLRRNCRCKIFTDYTCETPKITWSMLVVLSMTNSSTESINDTFSKGIYTPK